MNILLAVTLGQSADTVRRQLEAEGHHIRAAVDLDACSHAISDEKFDLVVINIAEGFDYGQALVLADMNLNQPCIAILRDPERDKIVELVRVGVQDIATLDENTNDALLTAIDCALARDQNVHKDNLTGLLNRALLHDRMTHAVQQARRMNQKLAVMFFDIDRFRLINDSFGHAEGDRLLKVFAECLRRSLRESDTIARLGGDAFIVLLPNFPNPHWITVIADKINDALSKSFAVDGEELTVTTSLGVSLFPADGDSADELIKCAEMAMKQVKARGGSNYRFFKSDLHSQNIKRTKMAHALRGAIDADQMLLHYQPQVDLVDGRVTGVEALIRWQHPEFGLVPPDEFIPLVEELGMMVQLGDWVLQTACQQRREWTDAGVPDFRIAVNLSAHQFDQEGLLKHVVEWLNNCRLDPEILEVELTEGSVMRDPDFTRTALQELKGAGIRIAIDDFGTGYSSLAYLKRFPLDVLKIDRSFVNDITVDPNGAALVRTIISLAGNLNLESVAEGVETKEQLEFVRANGCNVAQGYLYSKPLSAQDLPAKVAQINRGSIAMQPGLTVAHS